MSYQSVILADNPVAYWRLDELSGATIPDLSGNAFDGTYAPAVIYGLTSPIETDASSRAAGDQVGHYNAASGSTLDLRAAFSLEGWAKFVNTRTTAVMLARNGGPGLSSSNWIAIDASQIRWRHSPAFGSTFDLAYGPLVSGSFYYIVGTRIGSTMSLYVNGLLVARQTALPSGDIVYSNYNASSWKFGANANTVVATTGPGGSWVSEAIDEIALYDYALSDPQVLTHYEAGLLNPPLSGRADLHFNCTLDGEPAPTPVLFAFRHNWENEIRETLSWSTDVLPAAQDYEQRIGLRVKPRRDLEYDVFLHTHRLRRRFHAFLFANQKLPIYLPDWTDKVRLTADAAAGAGTLSFPSANLNFQNGGKLALYGDENTFEIVTIDTVGASSTTLTGVTTLNWTTSNCFAVPIARALIETDVQNTRYTDTLEETVASFRILDEDNPLTPQRNGTYTPRYTYQGLEVFDPFILGTNNWNEDGRGQIAIRAVDPESPSGVFSRDPLDTASRELTSYTFFLSGRTAIARFLAWLYSIQGRRVPVWVPTMQRDLAPISTVSTSLVVEETDYADFYNLHESRRDLAFIYTDQTMLFRRVSAWSKGAGQETLTMNTTVTLTNLASLSFLKLARLNQDTIDLVWQSDTLVEVIVGFLDLLTTP